jgi:hypothetical protein
VNALFRIACLALGLTSLDYERESRASLSGGVEGKKKGSCARACVTPGCWYGSVKG